MLITNGNVTPAAATVRIPKTATGNLGTSKDLHILLISTF